MYELLKPAGFSFISLCICLFIFALLLFFENMEIKENQKTFMASMCDMMLLFGKHIVSLVW